MLLFPMSANFSSLAASSCAQLSLAEPWSKVKFSTVRNWQINNKLHKYCKAKTEAAGLLWNHNGVLIYSLICSGVPTSLPHCGLPSRPIPCILSYVLSFHPSAFSFDISSLSPLASLSFLFNLVLFRHHASNPSLIRSPSQLLSPLGFSTAFFDQRWPSRLF